jgi:nicotinate-nucleotide adenylyltransferase
MRIGLFGGTFDPIHIGHLIVAQDVRERLGLDAVRFVVARRSPHKRGDDSADPETRFAMVQAAVDGVEGFEARRDELDRSSPSYTVDTLRAWSEQDPETEWVLVIGTDQYAVFETWHEPDEIRRLAELAVMVRPGTDVAPPSAEGLTVVSVRAIELSATDVRERVRAGRSFRFLVTDPVRALIEQHQLYRSPGADA